MMTKYYAMSLLAGSAMISGCATASFSPPSTNIVNEMEARGSNLPYAKRCRPEERRYTSLVSSDNKNGAKRIEQTAEGAIKLTNNFIYEYRCAAHSAGNSRQAFEIPGFLAGVGAATAIAFGAGSDVAIAGGTAAAVSDGSKDYYAPLQKAAIYDSSLDSFLCIKSVATGTKPFAVSADRSLSREQVVMKEAATSDQGYFSAERQFFEMVSAALFSVERIAASRIRSSARYDPEGVIAQIKELTDEVEDKGGDDPAGAAPNATQKELAKQIAKKRDPNASASEFVEDSKAIASSLKYLEILQPKLQLCIVRAKV